MKKISLTKIVHTAALISMLYATQISAKQQTEVKTVESSKKTTTERIIKAATHVARDCTGSTVKTLVVALQDTIDYEGIAQRAKEVLTWKALANCSPLDLLRFNGLICNKSELFTKLPYVLLSAVNLFTDSIHQQIKACEKDLEKETFSHIKNAHQIFKDAYGHMQQYVAEKLSQEVPEYTQEATSVDINPLLNAIHYPKLKQSLYVLVQSQIKLLNPHIPGDVLVAKILTEDNLIRHFDEALREALQAMLSPEEISDLVKIITHRVVIQLLEKFDDVYETMAEYVTPLLSPTLQVAFNNPLVTPFLKAFNEEETAAAA